MNNIDRLIATLVIMGSSLLFSVITDKGWMAFSLWLSCGFLILIFVDVICEAIKQGKSK